MAQADYYQAFFGKGSPGFSLLTHHTTYYWQPLLGPAFTLWQLLCADDPRSLKTVAPNFWTRPQKYSYADLASRLNRQHSRYICGDTLECHASRLARLTGTPHQSPADCCRSDAYAYLCWTSHPDGQGLVCKHWSEGLLEILHQAGLALVQLKRGERKPTIQIWRMPPLLTPAQYAGLSSLLQSDYDRWLEQHGPLFNLPHRQAWLAIKSPTLAPLMPGYDQAELTHNFESRAKKRKFMQEAIANPNFKEKSQLPD